MSKDNDARSTPRRRILAPPLLIVRQWEADGATTFFGYARNISRTGLFIGTVNPREPGARFDLQIPIPPLQRCVACRCEVIWQRHFSKDCHDEPGMGLKFIDLPEEVGAALDAWVREQAE